MFRSVSRTVRLPAHAVRLLLLLMLLASLAAPVAAGPQQPPVDLTCGSITRNPITGWPALLRTCTVPGESVPGDARAQADAFVRAYAAFLGVDPALADLQLVSVRYGLGSGHVVYQQTLAGHPVHGAYLAVHLNKHGEVQVLQSRLQPDLRLADAAATITPVQAVQGARAAIQFAAPRANSPAPQLMVLPMSETTGQLVWRVLISAAQPQGDWEVFLDAATGTVVKRYNRLVLARGQVFDLTTPQPATAFRRTPQVRSLPLQGLDGSGWLRGQYVDVTQPEGYRPAAAFSPQGTFEYDPNDPRFAEVMVYFYIDTTQRYLQSLGYSAANTPANGIRDRVTYASAHWFEQDQSFYSISDDALHFGDGGVPDAQDPDIILHEYAHALLHDLAPYWGGGDMDALGEGFGDYLAASLFAGTTNDPACIGEWDSRGYARAARCLRRVDRARQHPVNISGDPHADGEIWSRVLWDVRAAVGQAVADRLALESAFYLPPAATLTEAGQALLDADANLYNSAHRAAIVQALQSRGLAELPVPLLLSPAGGDTLRPGGLAMVAWQARTELPVAFELAWSADASAAGERQLDPAQGLPDDMQSYGQAGWQAVDGAFRSGVIQHSQTSSLRWPVQMVADGPLSFRYRLDTEQGFDVFEFQVDGVTYLRASGQQGWQSFTAILPAGAHELTWRYRKDGTVSSADDAVWLSDVRVDRVSLAEWQLAEVEPSRSATGAVLWRVPKDASTAAGLRIRSQLGTVNSPWASVSRALTIDEPTAVELASFTAQNNALPDWGWVVLGAVAGVALAVLYRRFFGPRR